MERFIVKGNLKISGLELLANPSKMIKKKPENTPEDKILLFRKLISEKLLTYIPNKISKDQYDNYINIMWQIYNEEKYSKDETTEPQLETN